MTPARPGSGILILGVDPGIAITGYGIVRHNQDILEPVAYGVITTPAGWTLPRRLQHLRSELMSLIEVYHPAEASVEELFFARNARTALSVGHARGVILLALADAGLPMSEYTPLQVKQAITGYGRASKEQMQEMVRLLLQLETIPQPDDAADALAMAICHAHSLSTAQRIAEMDSTSHTPPRLHGGVPGTRAVPPGQNAAVGLDDDGLPSTGSGR